MVLDRQVDIVQPIGVRSFSGYSSLFLEDLVAKSFSKDTISGYCTDLNLLNRFLKERYTGVVMLSDVQTSDIEDYLKLLIIEKKYKPVSVNRQLSTIKSFYNYAIKKGWTTIHAAAPIEQLKASIMERTFIDDDEYKELIQAIDHPIIKVIVEFLYYTGLRISECLALTFDDVNFERHTIHVAHGKGNKERTVPICEKLVLILKEYKSNIRPDIESNSFFALRRTGKVSDGYINHILHKVTKRLGWKKVITCHVLSYPNLNKIQTFLSKQLVLLDLV